MELEGLGFCLENVLEQKLLHKENSEKQKEGLEIQCFQTPGLLK